MWQEVGLIGRDKLLSREILPRIRGAGRFYLTGQRGIGKTAVLGWAFKHCQGTKAMVSSAMSPREFLIELCLQFGISPEIEGSLSVERKLSRLTRSALERLVSQYTKKGSIFIDEVEKIKPTMIKFLSFLSLKHQLFFAGIPPFKDEVKKYLWGAVEIDVRRLEKKDMIKLTQKVSEKIGRLIDVEQVVNAAEGIPGKMVQMAMGEIEWKKPTRTRQEEINIAPIFLLVVAGFVFVRYLSIGMNMVDLYILGGLGASLGLFARYFIYRMTEKK